MKRIFLLSLLMSLFMSSAAMFTLLQAQEADVKLRTRAMRDAAKQGDDAIPQVIQSLNDPDVGVRVEAVKALVQIGGPKTLDGLVRAAADNDAEIQIRATDGLVNVYLPGYVKTGLSGRLSRAGAAVTAKFTDTNDQVIDPFVQVRPDVIAALGKLARGGASLVARANAARALGVLRGQAAIADLVDTLRSKDDKLMYESLVAIQKIGDPAAAPRISFLLSDLEEKIQIQALETTGLLRNRDAGPKVRDALEHARSVKVRRAALQALAMIADPADHAIFLQNLSDKDDLVRAAAEEGLGRLKNPMDRSPLNQAFETEHGMNPRLSAAFALVMLGELNTERYGPLQYLLNSVNQRAWRGVAVAFLTELAREQSIRQTIYGMLGMATKDEKIQLSIVLARSGDRDSIPSLEAISKDADPEVAAEGIRSLRILRARLP